MNAKQNNAAQDLIRERMDDDCMHDCLGDFVPAFKVRSAMLQALRDGDDAELGRIFREHCEEWAVSNLWPNTDFADDQRQRVRDLLCAR